MNASAYPVSILNFCRGMLPLLLLALGCELGESPLAPKVSDTDTPDIVKPDSVNNNMRIRVLRSTLQASFDDSSLVEVTVVDENHNPISGKEVRFSADGGTIASRDTTDNQGIARVVFIAEPANRNVIIQASMKHDKKTITVGTTVTLTGVSVSVRPSLGNAPLGYTVPVKITLLDGKDHPIPDRPVKITGNGDSTKITDGQGMVSTVAMRATPGTITIKALALGALDSSAVSFGTIIAVDSVTRYMRVRASPSTVTAAYNEKAQIEVMVFDDNRNPVAGKTVRFTATAGTITTADTTDANGLAMAVFHAEPLSGSVVISAAMKLGDSTITAGTTIMLKGVVLNISPLHAAAPPGTTVPVTITLLDGKANPVPDRQILIGGNGDSTKTTNGAGEVVTSVTLPTAGTLRLHAAALGVTDTADVVFGTTGPIASDNTVRSLRLFSSHSQLRADNSDKATITAVLISADNHNPLVGETIRFSSNLGIISQLGTTDSSGRTTVTLGSAPVNGTCVVKAVLSRDADIADSTAILFSGVTLSLSADREVAAVNDTVTVSALLRDGSGNPISSDAVSFSVTAPGTFFGDQRIVRSTIDANGVATVKTTSGTATTVILYAASANVTDSIPLSFTTNNLSVNSALARLTIGGIDSTRIAALYRDRSGNPLAGETVIFATNAGRLTETIAITNSSGVATTFLKSGYFAAEATVQAKTEDGSAYTKVLFNAAQPGSLLLTATPDNIGINGGIAQLIATVKDDSGNVISGVEVSFRILKGPGGGEQIDIPIIASTNDGVARARLLAGTLPSSYRGCEVEARIGTLSSASRLTISGEPHTITISRPEDDTVKVPNGGTMQENTFSAFVGAVVKDVNGNPVADGTPVSFSAVVSGLKIVYRAFDRWSGVDSDDEIKPVYQWLFIDVPFEDLNGNFRMDPGIDLQLDNDNSIAARGDDINGDGVMDYDPNTHDFFWPFSGAEPYWPASKEYITITDPADPRYRDPITVISNRVEKLITPTIQPDSSSVVYDTNFVIVYDTTVRFPAIDSTYKIYADLNQNGAWDSSPAVIDWNGNGRFDRPASGDFEFWLWERRPQFVGDRIDFSDNDQAVVIERSVMTKDGVASTQLTYPRQFANRLYVTINAEVKGIRDRDGERFELPLLR